MTLQEDTRQQAEKHHLKHLYFDSHNIKYIRSKLLVGDYSLITDHSRAVDTKKDIQELIGNVTKDHLRFVNECDLAAENGITLIFLIIDNKVTCINDLYSWYNPRLRCSPKATKGSTLAKILHGIEVRHGVKFLFCKPNDAGKCIVDLLTEGKTEDGNA